MTNSKNTMTDEEKLEVIMGEQESDAIQKRKDFEDNLTNIWGYSPLGMEAKKAAMSMLSTKTGMYAKVPITCKADACPYAESCHLLPYGLAPEGEYCPIETTEIEIRYQGYSKDFDLENASFTDQCLVNEIINADIMMERCKALMATEGIPVVEVVAGVDERGNEIVRPEVSKFWEAYERASKKRNEAYQLMKATRRDKKEEQQGQTIQSTILEAISDDSFLSIEERPDNLK